MPAAIKYVPPTSPERGDFEITLQLEMTEFRLGYQKALNYYLGKQDRQIDAESPEYDDEEDDSHVDDLRTIDDNTVVNMVQMVADRTASFLFSELPDFVTDPENIDINDQEKFITKTLEANGGLHLLVKWALQGWLAGHTYLRVRPGTPYPKIALLSPGSVIPFWNAEDVSEVLWYSYTYQVNAVRYMQDFVRVPGKEEWRIYTYKEDKNTESPFMQLIAETAWDQFFPILGGGWRLFNTALHSGTIPPILETPHLPHPDKRMGISEFTQKDLQDAINRLSSVRNSIARQNMDPVDVITGADADDIETSGNVISISNPNARPYRFEMKGDMVGLANSIDKMVETFLAIGRVVVLKGDAKDLQRVTNTSVRTLFLDALAKNSVLIASYGKTLRDMAKLIVNMGFGVGKVKTPLGEDDDVVVKFKNPLPIDMKEMAEINKIGVEGKWMSRQEAATNMDQDWAFTKKALEDERELEMQQAEEDMQMEVSKAEALAKAVPKTDPLTNNKNVV